MNLHRSDQSDLVRKKNIPEMFYISSSYLILTAIAVYSALNSAGGIMDKYPVLVSLLHGVCFIRMNLMNELSQITG